jgi:hypothetical protein
MVGAATQHSCKALGANAVGQSVYSRLTLCLNSRAFAPPERNESIPAAAITVRYYLNTFLRNRLTFDV